MISVCPKTWKSATPFAENEEEYMRINRKTHFLGKHAHKVCQICASFPMLRTVWEKPTSTEPIPISQDHRITERFGLEGTLEEVHGLGHTSPHQLALLNTWMLCFSSRKKTGKLVCGVSFLSPHPPGKSFLSICHTTVASSNPCIFHLLSCVFN